MIGIAKITELVIKKMFSAYASEHGELQKQYFCESCSQKFSALWNLRSNALNPWINRGSSVLCPYCGKRHDRYIGYIRKNEYAPYEVKLSLFTYKHKVVLTVKYKAFCFTDLYKLKSCTGTEKFIFDVQSAISSLIKTVQFDHNDPETVSFPIDLTFKEELLSTSILQYFYYKSTANTIYRSQLIEFLRLLREEVTKKLSSKHKCKISSVYINSLGSDYGMFLMPLLNIANRMKFPMAGNLAMPSYRDNCVIMPTIPKWAGISLDWTIRYKEGLEAGKDKVTSMIEAVDLPNKDAVRRVVGTDFRNVSFLQIAFSLCGNYDLAIRFTQAFKKLHDDLSKTRVISFLKEMLKVYSEQDIIQFMDKAVEYNLEDCMQLYEKLTVENKTKLLENRIRLRELHDWMAIEHKKQNHVNKDLKVPQHIIKRLAMQQDKLNFFLPRESVELLKVGHSLNNCVATYSDRMMQGKQWIVIGTDDKGKYTACLRVQNNELVEAKINRNKPVANDPAINQAVIEWAKQSKLVIKTDDVRQDNINTKTA